MPVAFGGPKARGQRVVGDIVVSYQYVNGEPALVLFPLRARAVGNRGAAVVCLSSAWKYADDHYLMRSAVQMAETMGMGTDRGTVYRIARAVNDSLEDLVRMKPEPPDEAKAIGEGRLMLPDGKEVQFEVTDELLRYGDD